MNTARSAVRRTIIAFYRAARRDDPSLYKFMIFVCILELERSLGMTFTLLYQLCPLLYRQRRLFN